MESAAKRKAASAASPENDARPSKRQKQSGDTGQVETVETTTTNGLKFLESLRAAKDKTGRPIATHFLELPDKKAIPEYYDVIKLPVSIGTMEDKLNHAEYATLAQLESDCKRLVNNAKQFNDKKSIIYEDAERLRKTASNWMTKHNPAYRTHGYQAVPTPIPGEENMPPNRPTPRATAATPTPKPKLEPVTTDTTERPRRAAAAAQSTTPAPSKLRNASSATKQVVGNTDFAGKTFQQAQEQLVQELMDYVEPGTDLQIFQPFVNLPSRSLKDYYQLIKEPMSILAVQKKVRGVVGRNPPTGFTDLKSWNAFEEHVSLIWKNARDYNEDGSDIYNLSLEFEEYFQQRLEEAKANVEEPSQPKLKLNMSTAPKQQLRLKLRQSPGSDSNTPGGRSSATPGVVVDNDALLRQQRHVRDSMNGLRESRPSSAGKSQTPSASTNPFNGPRGASSSLAPLPRTGESPAPNGIKNDVQSPALNSIRPASNISDGQRLSVPAQTPLPVMPPPSSTSRPTSGSPHPNGPIGSQTVGYNPYTAPNYYAPPPTVNIDHYRKTPLKSTSEALIPKIGISTAPSLNISRPFSMTILANKEKTSQSVTISLPPAHSYLHVVPYLPVAFDGRPWRSFYTLNGKQYYESQRLPVTAGINGSSSTPTFEGGKKKGEPLYEAKLVPGVNRIEVEVIAEKKEKGKIESKDLKEVVDIEKCTVFVNLMRA